MSKDAPTKVCRWCEREKPLSEFYKNYKARDGRHTKCKQCSREIAAQLRHERKANGEPKRR